MSKGSITIDVSQLNNIAKKLKGLEKEMPGAVASSLNRTIDFVSSNIGRIVAKEYNIKASEFKPAKEGSSKSSIVSVHKMSAAKGDLKAGIRYGGRRLTFTHFSLTPKNPPPTAMGFGSRGKQIGKGYAVKVKIKKDGGKKGVNTNPKVFIGPTGTNNPEKVQFNAFKRMGAGRNPIEVLHTLSAPQMISNEKVQKEIMKIADKQLSDRIEHEIKYRLEKASNNLKRK